MFTYKLLTSFFLPRNSTKVSKEMLKMLISNFHGFYKIPKIFTFQLGWKKYFLSLISCGFLTLITIILSKNLHNDRKNRRCLHANL